MRILLVVVYYPPSTTSAAKLMHDLALEYVRQGHQVIVVTPSDLVQGAMRITEEDSVTVVRVKTGDLKQANKALRCWRESRLSARMWRSVRKFFQGNPCELIVFYSPTIFFGDLVRQLKSLWNCPSYLILRDIFPKWAVDAGVLRKGMLYRYLRRKELAQYSVADVIGVEAFGNLPYFNRELPGNNYRLEVLYNWLDTREQPQGRTGWREKLGLGGKVVFFYGGNIGIVQDMDNIVRLAASLRDCHDVFFLLVGSGSEVQRLNAEIERQDLRNIRILPPIPQQEYLQCLSEFDVGLMSLDRGLKTHNFPGKLLGYMLCGKPILASLSSGHDLIELLHHADAGIACPNGEDEKLRAAALLLATSPDIRQRMGRNARALGKTTFSVEVAAEQILSHFATTSDRVGIGDCSGSHVNLVVRTRLSVQSTQRSEQLGL
jgi:O26-antigen biosynthesis N-acetyl-L-fucosamine transferase